MKKALVIAEKYAAACDMAKVLECEEIKDGYMEGEDYLITWADDHLKPGKSSYKRKRTRYLE